MPQGGSPGQKSRVAHHVRCAALIVIGVSLAGCASTLSNMPAAMGGLPADAPARPAEGQQPAFPAVHDMPPPRQTTTMTPEQVNQTEAEMARLRDRMPKSPTEQKAR